MRHSVVVVIWAVAAGSAAYGKAPPSIPTTSQSLSAPALQQKLPAWGDQTSAGTGSSSGTFLADERWLGRAVHSSDGKYLGDVAALNEDDHQEFYVDVGGFLALGETRIIGIAADQLLEVHDDRLVLGLTELEASRSPTADSDQAEDL